jgi:hypothetical protein
MSARCWRVSCLGCLPFGLELLSCPARNKAAITGHLVAHTIVETSNLNWSAMALAASSATPVCGETPFRTAKVGLLACSSRLAVLRSARRSISGGYDSESRRLVISFVQS